MSRGEEVAAASLQRARQSLDRERAREKTALDRSQLLRRTLKANKNIDRHNGRHLPALFIAPESRG